MLTPYILALKVAFSALIIGIILVLSWTCHHQSAELTQVKIVAQIQEAKTQQINAQNEENENESKQAFITGSQAIHAYYNAHPAMRVYNTCASAVSETLTNSQGTNDTSASSVPIAYKTENVEEIANQLDQLQKLLIKDKVEVQ